MSNLTLFEQKHVRREWNSSEKKWYFSINDVVSVLTGSANVKDYTKKPRKRDPAPETYWGTNCPLVAMPGADGKNFKALTAVPSKALRTHQPKAD